MRTDVEPETGEMDPRLAEALNAFGASRYDDCRELAEDLIVGRGHRTPPTDSTIAECVGIIILSHLHEGDFAAARDAAKRLRPVSPDVSQDLLVQVNREERDYQTEITRLQRIVATAKDPAEAARAQLRTARTHQIYGRMELAEQSYLKVVDLHPDDISAARALRSAARLYREGKNPKEGLAVARHALETYPDSAYLGEAATAEIARHFAPMETRSECISYLEQFAQEHEGTEAAAYAVLVAGRLHVSGSESGLAEESWSRFLVDPDHRRASASRTMEDELTQLRVQMARATRKEGRDTDAVRLLEGAVSNPRWPLLCSEAESELADAYEADGRYNDAVAMFHRLQRDERDQRAALLLRIREAGALRRGGRNREATRTYEDVLEAAGGDEHLRAACLAGLAFSENGRAAGQ